MKHIREGLSKTSKSLTSFKFSLGKNKEFDIECVKMISEGLKHLKNLSELTFEVDEN